MKRFHITYLVNSDRGEMCILARDYTLAYLQAVYALPFIAVITDVNESVG
ncbi:MAG: hypothetical protein IJX38_04705 [Clostridia bacterium]|nr:hypothetical protein [Clostridia bacterium]